MILIAKQIVKSHPFPQSQHILQKIDLEVPLGQAVAICGRSGEGKTTLLHILGALDTPDEGEVWINGKKITPTNASNIRSFSLGFIFQSYQLLEDFTVLDNVLMPARIAHRFASKEHGLSLLRSVDLEAKASTLAKHLSGGEKQRVAIARALCNDPPLLLADEPSGSLDQKNAHLIEDLLFSFVEKKQKSLILVTHDTKLASRCDQSFELSRGVLIPHLTKKTQLAKQ